MIREIALHVSEDSTLSCHSSNYVIFRIDICIKVWTVGCRFNCFSRRLKWYNFDSVRRLEMCVWFGRNRRWQTYQIAGVEMKATWRAETLGCFSEVDHIFDSTASFSEADHIFDSTTIFQKSIIFLIVLSVFQNSIIFLMVLSVFQKTIIFSIVLPVFRSLSYFR